MYTTALLREKRFRSPAHYRNSRKYRNNIATLQYYSRTRKRKHKLYDCARRIAAKCNKI